MNNQVESIHDDTYFCRHSRCGYSHGTAEWWMQPGRIAGYPFCWEAAYSDHRTLARHILTNQYPDKDFREILVHIGESFWEIAYSDWLHTFIICRFIFKIYVQALLIFLMDQLRVVLMLLMDLVAGYQCLKSWRPWESCGYIVSSHRYTVFCDAAGIAWAIY